MPPADSADTAAILRSRARELRHRAAVVTVRNPRDAMALELGEYHRIRLSAEADGLERAAEVLEASLSVPDTLP
jgi:hypothetical protein